MADRLKPEEALKRMAWSLDYLDKLADAATKLGLGGLRAEIRLVQFELEPVKDYIEADVQ